jgi:hypothetical protein
LTTEERREFTTEKSRFCEDLDDHAARTESQRDDDSIVTRVILAFCRRAQGVGTFDFKDASRTVSCPWRLVDTEAVLLGGSDQGQKFGLPQPVDVSAETLRVLSGKSLEDAGIDRTTGDLCITFVGPTRIEVFNYSGGYEGWEFGDQSGLQLMAQGGGQIAIWDTGSVAEK